MITRLERGRQGRFSPSARERLKSNTPESAGRSEATRPDETSRHGSRRVEEGRSSPAPRLSDSPRPAAHEVAADRRENHTIDWRLK